MQIVDTNVLVHLLLDGSCTREARALYDLDADWQSEEFAMVEFSNVIATATRLHKLKPGQALDLLNGLSSLMAERLHQVPHADALQVAMRFGVSAYDARFLALAESIDTKLITEDAELRSAARGLTRSIADALAPS